MAGTIGRSTRQRDSIRTVLDDVRAFLSAQELHALLRERGAAIGLTTVYRNLQTLAEAGEVDVVRRADGEAVYRRCDTEQHHHHLVCHRCGRSVELQNDALEQWTRDAAARHGFSGVRHELELFGVCAACRELA